jgi:hypothetical protein
MAAPSVSQNGQAVLARSAQLTVTAAQSDHSLTLEVARVSDHRLIVGAGKVSVSLDGHDVPVTARPGGSYVISTRDQSSGAHSLDIVVSHDGIRELLTGTVSVPQQQSILDMLQGHGMSAWWVLNIAVVLIAVIIISRRGRRT